MNANKALWEKAILQKAKRRLRYFIKDCGTILRDLLRKEI